MLVAAELNPNQSKLLYHLNKFFSNQVQSRKSQTAKNLYESLKILQEILREVEIHEPRFLSSFSESSSGRFEGVEVVSTTEFRVTLFLNQMGVFSFADDANAPGYASLKLSDGRKRSMSLWVEFITASGYLSAKKLRAKFLTLVAQVCEKGCYRDVVKLAPDSTEVKLRIRDRFTLLIVPAFRCSGVWPRSASHWPVAHVSWPHPALIADVRAEGFDLMSVEPSAPNSKQNDGDSWMLDLSAGEDRLLVGGCRKKCLSILKSLRIKYLDSAASPVNATVLKTLLLYECEKHPREIEWDDTFLGDRINGILLQLSACLQSRRCPHYFLQGLDLFAGTSQATLESAAKQTWRLIRELIVNPKALDKI